MEEMRQFEVVVLESRADALFEERDVVEVSDAHRTAGHLVFVGRTDAAAGRADLLLAEVIFTGMVKSHVVRHQKRAIAGHVEAGLRVHSVFLQLIEFGEKGGRRKDNTVAEVALHRRMHDAGRNEAKHGLVAVHDDRMAGVVAPVEAHDAVDLGGEPVDDLALAFVTPLGADDHYIFCHLFLLNGLGGDRNHLPLTLFENNTLRYLEALSEPGRVFSRQQLHDDSAGMTEFAHETLKLRIF